MKLTRINSKLSTANKSPLGVWSCERRTERGKDNACSEGSSRRSCNARQLFASVVNLYSRQIGGVGKRGEGSIPSLDATLFIGVAVCCHVERFTFAHPQLPLSIVTHDIHIIVKPRLIPRSFRRIFIVEFFPTYVVLNHQIIAPRKQNFKDSVIKENLRHAYKYIYQNKF